MSYNLPTHNVGAFLDPKIVRSVAFVIQQLPVYQGERVDRTVPGRPHLPSRHP